MEPLLILPLVVIVYVISSINILAEYERGVIFRHGLRASLTPIATIFPLDMAQLVGGAVITESVFNLQGLGWLAINSVFTQDLPTVLGEGQGPNRPSRVVAWSTVCSTWPRPDRRRRTIIFNRRRSSTWARGSSIPCTRRTCCRTHRAGWEADWG